MLFKLYRYCNLLSIDVAVGACICSIYLARVIDVELPWLAIAVLGLTVWLIYTFDHLQDASKIKQEANTERYKFHQIYFAPLSIISAGVLVIIAVLIFYLPYITVIMGSALACLVIAYFLILYSLGLKASYHKEILIALIYSAGIFLAPISVYEDAIDFKIIVIFTQFANIAFINLVIFSWLESDKDHLNGFPSLVNVIGVNRARQLIFYLLIGQVLMSAFLIIYFGMIDVSVIILIMTGILGGITFFFEYFSQNERYRLVGDFIFLIPLLGLI